MYEELKSEVNDIHLDRSCLSISATCLRCSPKGAAVRSLPSPFWDDPTWQWSFVARHQWDLVAIFSSCRVYSQLLTDQTWHPTFFSQIWARFCSFSVGARFDPENDDPPTRLKRGYTMLHISSSGAPRVVESGFAGPIIVLVRVRETLARNLGFPE